MTKGYLVLAQNNKNDDYVKMAYILGMSIKITQKTVKNITLITDIPEAVPHHYAEVFDHILPIKWYDDALNSEWKIENRWKLYHLSPYDETIVLDADMLFLTDISSWWNYLSNHHDLFITDKVLTYRNEIVTSDYYRKTFTSNNLPNTYSAFTYFKKTDDAKIFWKMVELIVKDWNIFYENFLKDQRPKFLSIDVAFAIAVKLLGFEDKVFSKFEYPTFVHLKGHVQNWNNSDDIWTKKVSFYLNNNCQIKIGNFQQSGILHYTEKSFINDNVFYKYQKKYNEMKNEK